MANRTVYVGDSFSNVSPVLLQVADETLPENGPLNLSLAQSITVQFIGQTYEFSAAGTAMWPAAVDPSGLFKWNLSVPITAGDTAHTDVYQVFVVVTWSAGNTQTFPCPDTFTVMALPA